jgi:hypothetical protein
MELMESLERANILRNQPVAGSDPPRSRFRDAIDSMRPLPSHPNLDYAGIVLDEFAYRLPL